MIAEMKAQTAGTTDGTVDLQMSQSVLVAEVGHCNTSVSLFDRVDGRHRLIARSSSITTAGSPWYDASLGVRQAIRQISLETGRRFIDQYGSLLRRARANGSGVDEFALAISLGDAHRVILAGLLEEISISSARKVIAPLFASEVDTFSLSDTRNRPAQVQAILEHRPEVILLTGGTDGGANRRLMKLVQTLAMGIELLDRVERPTVVFAGNAHLRGRIDEILGELTEIIQAENVRPQYETENLDHVSQIVTDLLLAQNIETVPGLALLREWTEIDVRSSDHVFVGIGEYFAARTRGQIMCLDVGSNHVTLALASPHKTHLNVRPNLGVGHGAATFLAKEDLKIIRGWLGNDIGLDAIRNRIANKVTQPNRIPFDELDALLELGMVQRAIQRSISEARETLDLPTSGRIPQIELLLLRGRAVTGASNIKSAMLAILNSLEPRGIFRVIADEGSILPAIGLLATIDARQAVEVIDSGVLGNWGWVIVPEGSTKTGQTALEANLKVASSKSVQLEVKSGSIKVLEVGTNQIAELTLSPAAGIDVGAGKGKERTMKLKGGRLGIVIDARGRPLPKAKTTAANQELIQQSLREMDY